MEFETIDYLGYELTVQTLGDCDRIINLTPHRLELACGIMIDRQKNESVVTLINNISTCESMYTLGGVRIFTADLPVEFIRFFSEGLDELAEYIILDYSVLFTVSQLLNLEYFEEHKFVTYLVHGVLESDDIDYVSVERFYGVVNRG